jgi:VCBS repeat-containing protein
VPAPIRHRISLALAGLLLATTVPFAAPVSAAAAVSTAGVTSGTLYSVTFISATTGYAAADNGAILKTTNGGSTWTQVRTPDTYSFRGIDFWSDSNGVAVDYAGRVAKTLDGGATWTNVDFSPYLNMRADSLTDVGTFNDVAAQWGSAGVAITGAGDANPIDAFPAGGTAMVTLGNIRYWPPITPKPHQSYDSETQTYSQEAEGEFLDIEYVGASNVVWASGVDYWPIDGYNAAKYPLFKSTNGGESWSWIAGFGTNDLRLEGIAFDSGGTKGITVGKVVGTGARVVYYSPDGGATWTPSAPVPGTGVLNAVDMSSAQNGWAVGGDGGIIRTTDGGATWSACTITGGNANALYDVEFRPGTTTGWAVGASGTVLLTTDGVTWSAAGSTPVNTAPIAQADSYSAAKNVALVVNTPGVLGNDTDAESNPLTAVKVGNPSHGSVTLNADGSFTYTPTTGYTGADSFTYKANDGAADSNTVTVSIAVSNAAPVAVANSYSIAKNTALIVPAAGVLGNDTDANGDPLTAIKVGNPAHGSVTLNTDGSFTYTPTTGYTGSDSFTYKANDGAADSNTVAVSITVTATNTAPVAQADTYPAAKNVALVVNTPGVLANDTDPDSNPLTAVKVGNPSHGSVTLNANGSFTYTPEHNYTGADSFTYKAYDGAADSNTVTVNITVSNTAPVAVANSYSIEKNKTLTAPAPGVLGNDTDANSDPLTAIKVSNPAHGSATVNPDGSFTYTPTTNYAGADSFTYKANDGALDSNTVTVSITVTAPPPVQLQAVFRFYNNSNGTHFFTPSEDEKNAVIAKWSNIFTLEGVAYYTNPANNNQPLYRFYNKNSGSHFYTASPQERDAVIAKWSNVFSYDGETYKVSTSPDSGKPAVYRFYNMKNGSHFYTASAEEADMVKARWPNVYSYEGPAFWLGQ